MHALTKILAQQTLTCLHINGHCCASVLLAIFGTGSHMMRLSLIKHPHLLSCCHTTHPSGVSLYLLTCSRVVALAKYVSIAMPCADHYCYFKQPTTPTGIPPHSLLLGYVRGLRKLFWGLVQLFGELPSKIGKMFDERAIRGGLTMEQIVRAVDQSSQFSEMSKDVALVKQ